jgi:hypothetical protein
MWSVPRLRRFVARFTGNFVVACLRNGNPFQKNGTSAGSFGIVLRVTSEGPLDGGVHHLDRGRRSISLERTVPMLARFDQSMVCAHRHLKHLTLPARECMSEATHLVIGLMLSTVPT